MASARNYVVLPDDPGIATVQEQTRQEIQRTALDMVTHVADNLPEHNYWAFSFFTLILPALVSEINNGIMQQVQPIVGPTWNYLDAACALITGISQITDDENHRVVATKAKGGINILAAGQIITLTAINFTLLGGPGFAAAFGVGFLLSLDEVVRAMRRKANFEYWLQDSLSELEKTSHLILKLKTEKALFEEKIRQYEEDKEKSSASAQWALNRKKARLEKLTEKQNELERDITFRVAEKRCIALENHIPNYASTPTCQVIDKKIKKPWKSNFMKEFTGKLQAINACQNLREFSAIARESSPNQQKELMRAADPELREIRKRQITEKCDNHIKSAVKSNFLWGMGLAGMLLLCIPMCQPAGLILVGIASALYLADNINRQTNISGKISKRVSHYFFRKKETIEMVEQRKQIVNADHKANDDHYHDSVLDVASPDMRRAVRRAK
jgi:hypothetical protein